MKPIRPIRPHPFDRTLALVELTRGKFAVIDAVDAAAVGKFNWAAIPGHGGCWYAASSAAHPAHGLKERLHRFVAAAAGMDMAGDIDHRNRDGLDCRRSNLRPATAAMNAYNRKMRSDSRSGAKGVTFFRDGRARPWSANCSKDGKRVRKYFATREEAVAAIAQMRAELHGDFARFH